MAKRKPLVFIAGEIVESKSSDTLDGNNISVLSTGSNTERLLKDRFNDIINVKDYGAKGNGITDDTVAFQTAVSVAEQKNSVIYVPYGVYNISEPIEGEFISFGHPIITGNGSVTFLLDLYNDLVHKTQDVNETITGDKTFANKVTFNSPVNFKNPLNLNEAALTSLAEALLTPENNGFTALTNTNGKLRVNADEFIKANSGLATELQNNIKKLKIDLSNANAETLDTITSYLIKPNSGLSIDPITKKLQVDFQDITVDQLIPLCDPDGGIIVNNNEQSEGYGKLKIDFASMDPTIMRAVVYAMTQQGGGLSVDENGQLFVDFDSMPTDKFEAMLKAIHVPIWIGENGVGTEFYVDDTNGIDTEDSVIVGNISYPRGRSASYPWKTLPYATQTICKNYNINSRTVHINVAGGTYNTGEISLPLQQRTTGEIQIRPYTGEIVNIVRTTSGNSSMFEHSGGVWRILDMNLKLVIPEQTHTRGTSFPHILLSTDSTGRVDIDHCNLSFEDNSVAAEANVHGGVTAYIIDCNGGRIRFYNNVTDNEGTPVTSEYETTWSGDKGNAIIEWMYSTNGGLIELVKSGSSASRAYAINVEGSFSTFYHGSFQSVFRQTSTGSSTLFVASTATGKRYNLLGGAVCATGVSVSDAETFFPGNTNGTVDATTYSWIA